MRLLKCSRSGGGMLLLVLTILMLGTTTATADEDAAEPVKEPFVPASFVEPKLSDASSVYLWEYFKSPSVLGKTWLKSKAKKDGVEADLAKYNGEWSVGTPSTIAVKDDYGLIVNTAARHHAIAARLAKPYTFHPDQDRAIVVQYEVRFEEGQNCGGGYVKLLSKGAEKELDNFNDKTEYTIMFGPDKCSPNGKVHLIFRFRNPKNNTVSEHAAKQADSVPLSLWDDHKPHLYTLVVRPDGYYTVAVDRKTIMYGNIHTDLQPSLEPPAQIADPEDNKPDDWDEVENIDDVTAEKPEDWDENAPREIVDESAVKPADWLDDEEMTIPDAAAVKPTDWDNDMDGEWEPPRVDNPKCAPSTVSGCGEWKAPLIKNPSYKGKWIRPKIANPNYRGKWAARIIDNPHYFKPERALGFLDEITAVGIELWTMSKNIVFDNILVADKEETAEEAARLTYDVTKAESKRMAAEQGADHGIFQPFVDYAEERPWMWVVYVLSILLPLIIISVYCFGRKSSSTPPPAKDVGHRKKRDITLDDDEVPNLVDERGDEVVEGREEEEEDEGEGDDQAALGGEEEGGDGTAELHRGESKRKSSQSPARRSSGSKSPARGSTASASASAKKGGGARAAIEALQDSDSEEDRVESDKDEAEGVTVAAEPEDQTPIEKKSPAAGGPNLKKRNRPKKAD